MYEKYDSARPFIIHRNDFLGALSRLPEFDDADVEMFDALFTLFDTKGNDHASYREIIAAVAACLLDGTPGERIENAFEMYDYLGKTGSIARKDMQKVLHAINNTTSYFGDKVLRASQVDQIVSDTFAENIRRQEELLKEQKESGTATIPTEEPDYGHPNLAPAGPSLVNIEISDCIEIILDHDLVTAFVGGEGTVLYSDPPGKKD
jgi:Ca2+-binding EF-hand superfamily protein